MRTNIQYVDELLKYFLWLPMGKIMDCSPEKLKDHKRFCDGVKDLLDMGVDKPNGFEIVFTDNTYSKIKKCPMIQWKSFSDSLPKPLFK